MPLRKSVQFIALLALLSFAAGAAAQPENPKRLRGEGGVVQEITEQLTSTDPAKRQQALKIIRERLPQRSLAELRIWLRHLANAKMHQELIDLAQEGVLLFPGETRSVEVALQFRIRSLLALGRTDDALAESRSLFAVSSMSGTAESILLVAECIGAAHPDDINLFNKFREEQMAGAATRPAATQPAAAQPAPGSPETARTSTVLLAIKPNAAPYEAALKKFTGEDAAGLMARGNLLLMAGRTADARVLFNRLYSLAGAELTESTESIARCMKAEDGTIGRANAWILSLRPKK